MYRKAFPKCEVKGSYDPVEWGHMGSTRCIPKKCHECDKLFEGECLRAIDQVQDYLSLDYGPCKKHGSCEPSLYEDQFIKSKVYVPAKCVGCNSLKYNKIFGFRCHEEENVWGRYGKPLDWGHWSPNLPNIGLESGMLVSVELLDAVKKRNKAGAVKIFKRLNPQANLRDSTNAYKELADKLEKYS